ncbi:MAG: hypothetical protein AUJ92_07165 [Armatimonadetes bacterium CG2_30_59_28]|nr:MAG: hypothetical protein AUJ92_07165 [Armatimonadetes bacterium CG2_30_59_28]PIU63192.1 MAG: hypothetical protein COS85_16515 [Armatimonadetes bacterium CG07_land_8_20_14_0_80_59_28]PIX38654.1 MAG: hypothetical protein COZ56_19825 [Armatimonadetes bacterium CG_4_8_14_3_um_filter_58_9]PJB68532.1 MAG: hypothetical protein CO095_11100 [Armatimonadetes bacterium CG_4_9_14_3_um_filter_58_7]
MADTIMERKGPIEDLDRSFDVQFWQAQSPQGKFQATWELIVHACKVKGTSETWQARGEVDLDGLTVVFTAKEHLIAAKRSSGRPQDLIDADLLSQTVQQ